MAAAADCRISPSSSRLLADADIDPSVVMVGNACDEALARSAIGALKTEVVKRLRPRRTLQDA